MAVVDAAWCDGSMSAERSGCIRVFGLVGRGARAIMKSGKQSHSLPAATRANSTHLGRAGGDKDAEFPEQAAQ